MLKIAIVDDDQHYLTAIKNQIVTYSKAYNEAMDVRTFNSGLAFISDYSPSYDIVLLDIEMPHMDGLEVAKFIRKSSAYTVIIFITNMPQFAVNGYEVDAFDYMVKPINGSSFNRKLQLAIKALKYRNDVTIHVHNEDGGQILKAKDIVFIEVKDHWLYFNTVNKGHKTLGSLKETEELLKDSHFIRCDKSHLINLHYVTRMKSGFLMLEGNHKLTISRSRRKDVQFAFIDYYSQK